MDVNYLDNGDAQSKSFALASIGDNSDFCDIIKTKKILSMHTQESSLEDVFIKFTGRGLV